MTNKGKRLLLSTFVVLVLLGVGVPVQAQGGYDPDMLSYGVYWFGLNNARQKFVPGEANSYFDPAKPTMFFVHGWQPYLSVDSPPEFKYLEPNANTADAWINDGWNIGIFYWNQFSDEPDDVKWAEAKIWANDGPKNMRWKKTGGVYQEAPPGTPSAGELLFDGYVAAMTDQPYTGGVIRFAGHSLGNQMVTRLTYMLDQAIEAGTVPEHLRPNRVALLDPFWSLDNKTYLGNRTTADVCREYVTGLLPTGTLFEWYWSSVLTIPAWGHENAAMKPMMMYAEMYPNVFLMDDMAKHRAANHLYFWSYAFPAPAACSGDACLNMNRLQARMSDDQLAAIMRSDYTWSQTQGGTTYTPNDDRYASAARGSTPYGISLLQPQAATATIGDTVLVTATVTQTGGGAAPDGTLVTFDTDLGEIGARSVVSNGLTTVELTSALRGTSYISATTKGTNNTVQATASVLWTGPDLAISKTVTPTDDLPLYSVVTYTLVLSNTGDEDATGTLLTDTLPTEVDFGDWLPGGRPPGAAVDAGDELTWSGTVTVGEAITFTLTATHTGQPGDVVTNTVDYWHSTRSGSAEDTFSIIGPPELTLSKTVTPTVDLAKGGTVTYTLLLGNAGDTDALGALLTDTLPAEVDFGAWLPGGQPSGAAVNASGELSWTGAVSTGQVITFAFTAIHAGTYGEVVTNTAEVTHTSGGASAEAVFHVEGKFRVYLPVILKNRGP